MHRGEEDGGLDGDALLPGGPFCLREDAEFLRPSIGRSEMSPPRSRGGRVEEELPSGARHRPAAALIGGVACSCKIVDFSRQSSRTWEGKIQPLKAAAPPVP